MEFKNFKTKNEADDFISNIIIKQIKEKPHSVLGLATGSTPIGLYKEIIRKSQEQKINWNNVKTFNLDEYFGLDISSPHSYHFFMNEHLFNKLKLNNFNVSNSYFPSKNIDYDDLIAKNNYIDIQILGIGTNGHIGFNEPGSDLNSKTRLVNLTKSTIESNKIFFNNINDVPKQAISMGLDSILKAKKIILIAYGKNKREIIKILKQLKNFDIKIPASCLYLHPNVMIITDREAND